MNVMYAKNITTIYNWQGKEDRCTKHSRKHFWSKCIDNDYVEGENLDVDKN